MHSVLYNEAVVRLSLRPDGPLLIKAGEQGHAMDPTVPDMRFVRTRAATSGEEVVYVPGSSFKGALRSHAERLVRSVNTAAACDPLRKKGDAVPEGMTLRLSCSLGRKNLDKLPGPRAYAGTCYVCRVFGSAAVASRVIVGDLMPDPEAQPFLEERHGVAIDRITGAVAVGPFDIEVATGGRFLGQVIVRNFTLGQLGLVAAGLLDIGDGLVPVGFGKSKGFGRVKIDFEGLGFRYGRSYEGGGAATLRGLGAIAPREVLDNYDIPTGRDDDQIDPGAEPDLVDESGLRYVHFAGAGARSALEKVVGRWPTEVERGRWPVERSREDEGEED